MLVYGAYNIREYPSFVARFSVKRLRFNNVYFDDLVTALASLLIICGGSSILISLQGLSSTCVTSRAAYYVSAFINSAGVFMTATVVIFWGVFSKQVRDDMAEELDNLFYTAQRSSHYFTYAVNLVQKLGCCGVRTEQDYIDLVPITRFGDNLYNYCTNYRACAPVLQDHFRTFSAVGISLTSLMLLFQIFTVLYANKKVRELPTHRSSCETDLKTPRDTAVPPSSCEADQKTPRVGVFGRLKQRVIYLWKEDHINGVSLITKILTLMCALSLIVTGLQLKFDYIFADIDLFSIFYLLGFNNRRFTYYLTAFAYGMLGLGIAEMTISLYGLIIYSWNSKFLEYTLIALRVTFTITLIVILGLSIESQSNIAWTMYDQLVTEFQKYSNYHEDSEIPWKWLYFKMECCGIGNYGDFNRLSLPYGNQIPIHCCTNVTTWDPGLVYGQENCTNHLLPGSFHETGCNDVLLDRFGSYTITLFTLISFLILFQIFDIVMSGRRIYILTPGSKIDKEIGILVQSVTRKLRKSNVTDSNEELLIEESTVEAGLVLPATEDMKRNTLLPSLEGEKDMALITNKPPTDKADDTSRRGKRRKDKKQRNKHQTNITEVTEPVAKTAELQDTDSSAKPLETDPAARTISGRRAVPSLSSTRSARKRRENATLPSPNPARHEIDHVGTKTDTGETIPIPDYPKFDSNDNQGRSRPISENVSQENSSSLQTTSITRENIDIDNTDVEQTKSDDADKDMKTGKGEQENGDNSLPYKSEVDNEENRKEDVSQNKAWSDRKGTTESARQENTYTEVKITGDCYMPRFRNGSGSSRFGSQDRRWSNQPPGRRIDDGAHQGHTQSATSGGWDSRPRHSNRP
ncbi:uncharacterized protein [Argopecten irradians]|uniref:uncharacterized protein n=1 Tax=Argopecten irradians TaxID=31199 RepID=UPI0037179676